MTRRWSTEKWSAGTRAASPFDGMQITLAVEGFIISAPGVVDVFVDWRDAAETEFARFIENAQRIEAEIEAWQEARCA